MKIVDQIKTEVIDNFSARLTRKINGSLNSGFAKYSTTHSVNNFQYPGNLTWMESAVRIDSGGTVITDLIVAGKERVESGISYVYAIGHLGRLYKIQVNNPSTKNPNYDTPVLLNTLSNGQTFTMGGSIEFYGASGTTYIFIGHDSGVTRINFDGSTETVVGITDSTHWIAGVPRMVITFLGKLYYTNSTNIAEIDTTLAVTSYTKISPGFPLNTQARDIKYTADGRYAVIVASELSLTSILATTQDTTSISSAKTYLIYWNGTDTAASSFSVIPSFAQTSYYTFGGFEYLFGYDLTGAIVSTPQQKILTNVFNLAPLPNAVGDNGNILGWMTPGFDQGFYKANLFIYGALDEEVPVGYYRQFKMAATGTSTDILQIPFQQIVGTFNLGFSTSAYTGSVVSVGKIYFSTLEYNGTSVAYKFYYFCPVPAGLGTTAPGVYETQTELFSNKRQIKEVRVYTEPLIAGNIFTVALIGSDGNVITNSSQTFTVGSTASVGQDMMQYNPGIAPTYALGLRITNVGTTQWVAHKAEIDHCHGGE